MDRPIAMGPLQIGRVLRARGAVIVPRAGSLIPAVAYPDRDGAPAGIGARQVLVARAAGRIESTGGSDVLATLLATVDRLDA